MSRASKTIIGMAIGLAAVALLVGVSCWHQAPVAIAAFGALGLACLAALRVSIRRYIAERQRAEALLQESDTRFRRFTEVALTGVYIVQEGKFHHVNAALAQMFGYTPEELIGKLGPVDLTHPDDRALVAENIRRRVAGEVEWLHFTFRGQRKDGQTIECEALSRRLDYHGRPAIMGTLLNITERKRAEERLRLQTAALESAANGILITDRQGDIVWVNPAVTRMTGYTQAEVIGQNPRLFKSGRHDAAFYKEMWDTILRGEVWQAEFTNRRKNGTVYVEEQMITPVRDHQGQITHFISIKQDVTARKTAERELHERTASLQLLQVVAVAANEAQTSEAAFQAALSLICAYTGWPVGHVYLRAADGSGELISTRTWHLHDPQRFAPFREMSERTRYQRGVGLPGRVLASGQPASVLDFSDDPGFPRREAATVCGLRAGFAFPVWVGPEMAAVVEFFSDKPIAPDSRLLHVMGQIGTLLGRVVERQRAMERISAEAGFNAALLQLETAVDQAQDSAAVGAAAVALVPQLFNGASACVWRWNGERRILTTATCSPTLPAALRAKLDDKTVAFAACPELARVLETRQVVVVTEAGPDSALADAGSCLLLPLLAGESLLGVMAICRSKPGAFGAREMELAQAAAQRIAQALQGQLAREDAQQQLARVRLLNQIARAIADRHDLESLFRVVLQHLEDQLPVDMASVALYDPVAQTCTIAARNPKARAVAAQVGVGEGTILPVKDMLLGDCINNKVVYLHDLAVINQPLAHRLVETGLRSAVGTPLVVEGRVLGVLQTARKVEDGFSSAECEFLQMLSEHVALAAHHARLIASLQSAYDELRQTQRAVMQQERLRALGQMASGIAHDVNNALSPIAGYTDLLLNDEPGLGERARRYVTTIRTAAEDIGHTVARLREFYRQRREQDVLAHVNLPGLIQQVIDLTRPRWRDIPQQHGVMVKLAPEVPRDLPSLLGIESEIREALTNLIINAVDAMPQGGTLGLRARTGRLGKSAGAQPGAAGLKRPTHVIIEVSDTGVGMDEETRRRCLEPFFSTKGERGTGLGLSMVYGVVQRHEGDIEVESAPDKGTLVRLIFPLREGPAMVVPPAPEEALPAVRMRILCIDDEPLLREMMKDLLQRDGHTVEVADGGQSGLDKFRAANREGEPFDVVLTDLGMPYIGGHEVARTVKRESPNTPVIVMTGWGSRFVSETKVIAADYVLSKPPKSQELRRLLAHLGRKTSP